MPAHVARVIVAGVGIATAAAAFFFIDLGGTIRTTVSWYGALAVAWWSVPFVTFVSFARTLFLLVAGGAVLNVVSAALLVALLNSESSTSGIGILTIPPMLVGGVFVTIILERLVLWRQR